MLKRFLVSALVLALVPSSSVLAQSLTESATKELKEAAAVAEGKPLKGVSFGLAQGATRGSSSANNARTWTGAALAGVGSIIVVSTLSSSSNQTGLGMVGLGMAGFGGYFLYKGLKHSPSVQIGPGRFAVQKRIEF